MKNSKPAGLVKSLASDAEYKSRPAQKTQKKSSPEPSVHVMIVDDHKIVASGLKALLESGKRMKVTHVAHTLGSMKEQLAQPPRPNIILMDLSIGAESGLDGLRYVKEEHPGIIVIALTADEHVEKIKEFIDLGGDGYCAKAISDNEIETAIIHTLNGEKYISEYMRAKLMSHFLEPPAQQPKSTVQQSPLIDDLTTREIEIVKLIAQGKTSNAIGEELFISPRTVETHRKNIMSKLGVHNTTGIVRYALKHLPDIESQHGVV